MSLPGVTTPYLYFGMWRSIFAWCALYYPCSKLQLCLPCTNAALLAFTAAACSERRMHRAKLQAESCMSMQAHRGCGPAQRELPALWGAQELVLHPACAPCPLRAAGQGDAAGHVPSLPAILAPQGVHQSRLRPPEAAPALTAKPEKHAASRLNVKAGPGLRCTPHCISCRYSWLGCAACALVSYLNCTSGQAVAQLPLPLCECADRSSACLQEILVSPELLRQHNIPVVRMIQYPGEWIISAPGAYHSGFNHGYNCAESTNFATSSWLPFGAVARPCYCRKDTVQIQARLASASCLGRMLRKT